MDDARNRSRRRWQYRWLALTATALVLSLLAMIAGTVRFAHHAAQARLESDRQVDLNSRIRQMQELLIALGDAEAGQRGYLLTGNRAYLKRYDFVVARMPTLLASLDEVPIESEALKTHARDVRHATGLKLKEMAETISLYDQGDRDAALALVETDTGKRYMDFARAEVDEAMRRIRDDRDAATVRLIASNDSMRQWSVWTAAALVLCVALASGQLVMLISAQRRFSRQLAASERRHRAIVEEQQELISLSTRDGTLVYVNPAFERFRAAVAGGVTGMNLYEFIDPPDRVMVQKALDHVFLTGSPTRLESRVMDGHGTVHWIAWACTLQRASDGTAQLHSVGRDVTERRLAEQALRELNEILEHSPDFIVQSDRTGRIQYMNPAARHATGLREGEAVGRHHFTEFNPPDVNQRHLAEITPTVKREGVWIGETTILLAGGPTPVSHVVIGHRDQDGRIQRYSAVMRDISQEVANRAELRRKSAALESIVEAIPAVVAVLDKDLRYRMVNRAFERWRGQRKDNVLGRSIEEMFGQAEHDRSGPWAQRALAGETVSFEKDYPDQSEHRHMSISYVPMRLDDGSIDGIIAVGQDITAHREKEQHLLQLSEQDALTGVLNRAGFQGFLQHQRAADPHAQLGILYIDLDRFKPVNDLFGHQVGDELLRQFAERLKSQVRPTDAVARLGGDEFAVVLVGAKSLANVQSVADKVVDASHQPFEVLGRLLQVGASVGVAFGDDGSDGYEGLIAEADAAVYAAKAAGRGRRA